MADSTDLDSSTYETVAIDSDLDHQDVDVISSDDAPSAIKGTDVMASSGMIIATPEHGIIHDTAISLVAESLSEDCSALSDHHTETSTGDSTHYQSIIYMNHSDGQVTIPADHSILLGPDSQGGTLHLDHVDFGLNTNDSSEIEDGDHNSMLQTDTTLEDNKIVNIAPTGLAIGEHSLTNTADGLRTVMIKTVTGDVVQVIPVQSLDDLSTMKTGGRLVQMMSVDGLQPVLLIQGSTNTHGEKQGAGQLIDMASGMQIGDSMASLLVPSPIMSKVLAPGTPMWAARIQECEKIGDSYRGWVESEIDLDLLLTYHKQQTNSFWGTRQSPSPAKPSTRLMWKSQYVHFDGVPFINAGSRAIVLECQFGPRRKGAQAKRQLGDHYKGEFRKTCPARIYIKKVKKFPEYAVDINLDKKAIKIAMDKAFMLLRDQGLEQGGQERYYVQLPTEGAHEFHGNEVIEGPHRLDPRISEKIRECVSKGETRLYVIRRSLRIFVEKELFSPNDVPEKHNLTFYPTVNDLQNHIHQAVQDIETGMLALNAPHMTVEMLTAEAANDNSLDNDVKDFSLLHRLSAREGQAQTESVTVTLTQNPDEDGQHVISKVETHLSDGTTQITTNLTPETAKLLSKIHPNLFPSTINTSSDNSQIELPDICVTNDQHLTSLSSDLEDDPDQDVVVPALSPPTHYIIMESPGEEKHVYLQDGSTGMTMDHELVTELKHGSTDLGVAMETEDVSDSLVKLESDSEMLGHYNGVVLDQTTISSDMEDHIHGTDVIDEHTDSIDEHIAHTDSDNHNITHDESMDHHITHTDGIGQPIIFDAKPTFLLT